MSSPVRFVAPVNGITAAEVGALATTARGAADGVAPLDSAAKLPAANLPIGSTAGTVAGGDVVATLANDVEGRLQRLEQNPYRFDRDMYGDVISNMARHEAVNPITLVNGTIYATRLYGRCAVQLAALRMATAVAGVGGTCAIALYDATTAPLPQVRSGTINLATLGRVTHTLSSTYTTVRDTTLVIAILPTGYSTPPQLGGVTGVVHSTMLNPNAALAVAVTKAGQATLPASIDVGDGTWTITGTSKLWTAVG